MNRYFKHIQMVALIQFLIISGGCATGPHNPPKTQLQIRQAQTRTFDLEDSKVVLKLIVNVLQDEGFIIKEANTELGILYAVKEMDEDDLGTILLATLLGGSNARWETNSVLESTVNVSGFGGKCRVRVNFQKKVFTNRGAVSQVKVVEDPLFYQNFFEKIDKGLFLQKEKL